jgi:diacylglycerol kinase
MPKFHDRISLMFGGMAGLFLSVFMLYDMFLQFSPLKIVSMLIGVVLTAHCADMLKYYKKHRIIKVVKTENQRIIYKESDKPSKLLCAFNALKLVLKHKSFIIWFSICLTGIVLGLIANIGMTRLVILVTIACFGLALETANTSIEFLLDFLCPQYDNRVKDIKDLFGLAPVFVYSTYVVTWGILVIPTLWRLL